MSQSKDYNARELAQLARIELTEEEEEIFNRNLQKILKYMHLIDEVDTEGVFPCAHVIETMYNVMSEDEIGSSLPRDIFLRNTSESIGGMIKIPLVLNPEE